MPYELVEYVQPQGGAQFAILEDLFLQGSFRVLQTEEDKANIDPTVCKQGMIVYCVDSGKTYALSEVSLAYDDIGDAIFSAVWSEFSLASEVPSGSGGSSVVPAKALSRWQLTVKSGSLAPGAEWKTKLPFAKAIILERLTVDKLCDMEFKETSNSIVLGDFASFNNTISQSFTDPLNLTYSSKYVFPDGTPLMTRYTQLFINKDPVLDKFYYYKVINRESVNAAITTKFLVIGIHT
jgi:hypothetical protein